MDAEPNPTFRIERVPLEEREKERALRLCAKILADLYICEKRKKNKQAQKDEVALDSGGKENIPRAV